MKGVVKALIALVIIVGGAGIGFLIANNSDLGKASTVTPTVAAVAASAATVTPIPTFTPAVAAGAPVSNTQGTRPAGQGQGGQGQGGQQRASPGAGGAPAGADTTTPGAGAPAGANTTPGAGGRGQGQGRGNQVAGTISKYDAAAKKLVITAQDGTPRNVSVANARFSKSDKITQDELAKATGAIMLVQGERCSDGVYSARTVTMIDPTAGGGGFLGGGAPGTPGAGGFPGGGAPGAQGGTVILNGVTVSGNTITGKSFQGEDIKVNVSDTTILQKQLAATPEDLTEGKRVTITGQASTNGEIEAVLVTLVN